MNERRQVDKAAARLGFKWRKTKRSQRSEDVALILGLAGKLTVGLKLAERVNAIEHELEQHSDALDTLSDMGHMIFQRRDCNRRSYDGQEILTDSDDAMVEMQVPTAMKLPEDVVMEIELAAGRSPAVSLPRVLQGTTLTFSGVLGEWAPLENKHDLENGLER